MPEYLSPGVFIEEIPSGTKSIEGVSTSTAGFVGPACSGPINRTIGPITSLAEFAQHFGDDSELGYATPMPNFMWHGVRLFFLEGGQRLWVARVSGDRDRPGPAEYERGLAALEDVDEISVVAAPGACFGGARGFASEARAISAQLVAHAEQTRNRIALLDTPDGQGAEQAREWCKPLTSSHAAVYFPWIAVTDPRAKCVRHVPPSGAIAGIYARIERERGVHKAPANDVVRSAEGLEAIISDQQQHMLISAGINGLRHIRERGVLIWGARTLDTDAMFKYVNFRRLLIYLEASIGKGLQWAVYVPNGEPLWASVRGAVQSFLLAAWRTGALVGTRPAEAFFVQCDRTTMTQNDLDNGRLVCLIGVAPLRPAEFVVFRIGQLTVDASS